MSRDLTRKLESRDVTSPSYLYPIRDYEFTIRSYVSQQLMWVVVEPMVGLLSIIAPDGLVRFNYRVCNLFESIYYLILPSLL